ncbi:hypothetical protein [Acinetobacter nematophilus]|uniref:Uncharacterized protein n=1 Tax=Acinetobacter nematophilus TaxID=2994642 RepID=A0A9X3IGH2_9GAMM|nr:hypothetical protein [Acinetobacter nematophilus]MCX5467707.1 hypothetical protein [Acinetobacter nematophilus]
MKTVSFIKHNAEDTIIAANIHYPEKVDENDQYPTIAIVHS